MGADRSGPGDGHGGWGTHPSSKARKEAQMTLGREWLDRACHTWEQQGTIYPSLWAEGEELLCVAIPMHREASQASPLLQSLLLSMMAQTVQALALGTLHEAWTKEFVNHEEVAHLKPGELEQLAEVDPEVRTAIITTWGDLKTGKIFQDMATVGLSDEGDTVWEISHSDTPQGLLRRLVQGVMLGEGLPADDPETVLAKIAESMDWQVLIWNE